MLRELIVKEALTEDVDVNKVRLSRRTLKDLRISEGDVVSLQGKESSCGIVFRDPSSEDENHIRLNKETRRNCSVNIGDRIAVERVEASPSVRCTLAPWVEKEKGKVILSLNLEEFIRKRLLGRPVSPGDIVVITGIAIMGEGLPFRVVNSDPGGIVRITEETMIVLELPVDNGEVLKINKAGYEDIGGLSSQLESIREMVELPLHMPHLFSTMGIVPPKGLLLHGPPGTGKTLITRALEYEIGVKVYNIRGPEIMDSLYGRTEKNLRDIFTEAVNNSPSIIFIDEIDSIAPKRELSSGDVEKRVVAQLLTLMDSLPDGGQVIVIGTTNRPDAIEEALRRPGRFDREVELPPPDEKGREDIFAIHTRGMPLSGDVDFKRLRDMTIGYVGADIQALCREAALSAIKRHLSEVGSVAPSANELITNVKVDMADFQKGHRKILPSAMREIMVQLPVCSFEDIGGLNPVKRDLRECVEKPFSNRDDYRRLGIKTPNGIILYGPTGTGKTLLARAVAHEVNASFISVKGPEILSRFVGEAEKRLRSIFSRAKQVSPSIIFFDEVDSVARERGGSSEKGSGQDNLTNQFLTLMDGIEHYEDVIVIGATNRPELIDEAFLRKGRFDRAIYVPPPSSAERLIILGIHTRNIPVAAEVDLAYLAERTDGFSGADIEGLCQEAAMEAFREDNAMEYVGSRHFENALRRLKPSISKETIKYYNTINKKLTCRVTTGGDDETPFGYG